MKKKYFLFRCHGPAAEASARAACEFITGYFDLSSQRARVFSEPMETIRPLDDDITPQPYDVFIETARAEMANIAHAAGYGYLMGQGIRVQEPPPLAA